MKLIILITLILSSFHVTCQTQAVIGQPEMRMLYVGYPNIIECAMMDVDSTYISCNSEEVSILPSTYGIGISQNACFEIHIYQLIQNVELEVHAIKNGQDYLVSKEAFKVRAFPIPSIQNTTISHTTGASIHVSLGPDCPFTNSAYEVMGGEVTSEDASVVFSGNHIPSSAISQLKPGKKVVIEITCRNLKTSGSFVCSSVLTVVP